MPARSQTQQRLFAIAEHAPGKLYSKNRGLLKMSHSQLHDFAATKRSGLPEKASGKALLKEKVDLGKTKFTVKKGCLSRDERAFRKARRFRSLLKRPTPRKVAFWPGERSLRWGSGR